MRARNLDSIYVEIEKCINLVEGYTEIAGIGALIKMCRLKPYKMAKINKKNLGGINLYRWWVDEDGNSLRLEGKQPKIVFNDLGINRERLNCTDLYAGLPIHKVYRMSRSMLLLVGKERDSYQDVCAVALLGIDDYLRTFVLLDGRWSKFPSLYLGLPLLLQIANGDDLETWKEVKVRAKETIIVPCVRQQVWLTSLPVADELRQVLNTLPIDVVRILNGDKQVNG
jgi:hypothetical protein